MSERNKPGPQPGIPRPDLVEHHEDERDRKEEITKEIVSQYKLDTDQSRKLCIVALVRAGIKPSPAMVAVGFSLGGAARRFRYRLYASIHRALRRAQSRRHVSKTQRADPRSGGKHERVYLPAL